MRWWEQKRYGVRLVSAFLLLAIAIGVSAWLYYRQQKHIIQHQRDRELGAIADLKVSQIENWRQERLADGAEIRDTWPEIEGARRTAPPAAAALLARMSRLRNQGVYPDIEVVDAEGRTLLSSSGHTFEPERRDFVRQALAQRAVLLSDFHRNIDGQIRLDLCVPFPAGETAPSSALVLEVDPAQSLYPILGNWPAPSETAECILLRRDDGGVLFLNELRHRKGTALALRLPLEQTVLRNLAPDQATIGEALDYRGTPVVGAVRRVAGTPWILVAKMDLEELYSPLSQTAVTTGLFTLLLLMSASTGMLLLWREGEARSLRRHLAAEADKRGLMKQLEVLSRYSHDIILWADPDGRIQDVNERAIVSYGYPRAELLQLTMADLLPLQARENFARDWARLGAEYSLVIETDHQRKNGSRFPVEINVRLIVGERNISCQSIIVDTTERRRAEEKSLLLSSIVESSDDAIIGESLDATVVSWNRGAERLYGYTALEMVGRPISVLVPPQCRQDLERILTCLREGEHLEHFETERVRKDGQSIFVSITLSPLRDRAQRIIGASVIARDISERRQAEIDLAKAHQATQAILDSISDGFVALDREWRYTYVNRTGARMLGKTPEALLGRSLWDVFPRAAEAQGVADLRAALQRNTQARVETFYEPLQRWFEVRCYPSDPGVVLFFTDTTERKRNERALQLSEERFRSVVLVSTQIVWTANAAGEFVEDLPMWLTYTGQSPSESRGWGRAAAIHPDDRRGFFALWQEALSHCTPYSTEYRLRRHDGEYRWMASRGVPVRETGGAVREWVGTCTDITDRKQWEHDIRELNQHLEERVLERTNQLREANQELEAFAYSVSHDLRAPLRAVNGFSQILLDEYAECLPADAVRFLEMTRKNALQMGDLIDGLLKFSRLSRQPLCKQPLEPADLVEQAWEDLHAEHIDRQVEFRVAPLEPCAGDALLLRQVFVNLLSNALKYSRTREVTRIEVGMTDRSALAGTPLEGGETPVYFVRDNGVGFDVRYREKLFGVFQRLHRAEDYEGAGVGLATVQRIVHRHGGQVWADSVLNEGSTFCFTLAGPEKASERKTAHAT